MTVSAVVGKRAVRFAADDLYEQVLTCQGSQALSWLGKAPQQVLEVGCSAGHLVRRMLDAGHAVLGFDTNAEHVRLARERNPGAALWVGSADEGPWPCDDVDAVVMVEVLEHVDDDGTALAEAARVLRPGGRLVLTVPHRGLFAFLDPFNLKTWVERDLRVIAGVAHRIQRFGNTQFTGNLYHHRHYALAEVESLLTSNFRIKDVRRTGLVLFPLASAAMSVAARITAAAWLKVILQRAMNFDGRLSYGRWAYNLMLLAERR